jgi:2-aminoadipate transaminase
VKISLLNDFNFPSWVKHTKPSAIDDLIGYASQPDFISFALGLPDQSFLPKAVLTEVTNDIIENEIDAFQYSPPLEELKTEIVKLMHLRGVSCDEKQIFLTSGGQQGLNLLVTLLLERGQPVILEELVYPGILQSLKPFSPEILTVPTDLKTGMDVEAVERILKSGVKPAFIYIVADGSNPLGVNLALDKRKRLAELANTYGVPIIEDDPYGFLNYSNQLPCIKSFGGENIFYVGSFSKIFSPALRTGWVVVPECFLPLLVSLKESFDVNIATFGQRITMGLLRKNIFESHMQILCSAYRERRDKMILSLNQYFPTEISFETPDSGFFIWVNFIENINTTLMLEKSLNAKVSYIPSQSFSAIAGAKHTSGMRLNFSYSSSQQIEEGIKRLAETY